MTALIILAIILASVLVAIQIIRHKFAASSDQTMAQISTILGVALFVIVATQTGLFKEIANGTFGASPTDWLLALIAAGGVPLPIRSGVTKSGQMSVFSGDPADISNDKKSTVITVLQLVVTVLFKIFKW